MRSAEIIGKSKASAGAVSKGNYRLSCSLRFFFGCRHSLNCFYKRHTYEIRGRLEVILGKLNALGEQHLTKIRAAQNHGLVHTYVILLMIESWGRPRTRFRS